MSVRTNGTEFRTSNVWTYIWYTQEVLDGSSD